MNRNWQILGFLVTLLLSPQLSAPVQSQTSETLTVGPGDVLEISVLGIEELSRRVRILGDGTITMPLLGNFRIAGLTVKGSEELIARM
ncbi:MAG: polysaccharide biosynthesis/export family protein, partial [Thermoanaerobaculia bacterium]